MAATQTVPQYPHVRNFPTLIASRHGVVTLFGYGIKVRVDRGHLILEDGIGPERRQARLPRVGHRLRRLVVIGADGMVSFAALRWLADQDASFVMLDRDGSSLITTGPVRPSDARLRRAQSLAHESGLGLQIALELIRQKLIAQERTVRNQFQNDSSAHTIAKARKALMTARSSDEIRRYEAQAALAYWAAWHELPITYPRADLCRVPNHWRNFGSRVSPLTSSPRLAANPPNAMLNYLYAVLESEARLALTTLGLDPGIGFLHNDSRTRDSLACDLMEPIRPQVDAFLLEWLSRAPLQRKWFFEQGDGNCRLMGSFAIRLSETAEIWGRAVAPFAEWISHTLWSSISRPVRRDTPATRLTQRRKREAKNVSQNLSVQSTPSLPAAYGISGTSFKSGFGPRGTGVQKISRENISDAIKPRRIVNHDPIAQARRAETQRRQAAALRNWNSSDLPDWLNERAYRARVQPLLSGFAVRSIATALGVSHPYAAIIRAGRRVPHPRHWLSLAGLVGLGVCQIR